MLQPVIRCKLPKFLLLEKNYFLDLAPFGVNSNVNIPGGFIWDGASIPRVFWLSIGGPYHPKFSVAGLVHDYLYKTHKIARSKADKVFYELLRENSVGYFTAKRMWLGVRTGGIFAWKKYGKNS